MTLPWHHVRDLLGGPLLSAEAPWPLVLRATLCDLRPRFLPKGAVGRAGHRAVARNGRVLLCSDRPVAELAGLAAVVRFQTWHRAVLPGDEPAPHGLLLCVRGLERGEPLYAARLAPDTEADGDLTLDVGGTLALELRALRTETSR
jgi:hypothetical protein